MSQSRSKADPARPSFIRLKPSRTMRSQNIASKVQTPPAWTLDLASRFPPPCLASHHTGPGEGQNSPSEENTHLDQGVRKNGAKQWELWNVRVCKFGKLRLLCWLLGPQEAFVWVTGPCNIRPCPCQKVERGLWRLWIWKHPRQVPQMKVSPRQRTRAISHSGSACEDSSALHRESKAPTVALSTPVPIDNQATNSRKHKR